MVGICQEHQPEPAGYTESFQKHPKLNHYCYKCCPTTPAASWDLGRRAGAPVSSSPAPGAAHTLYTPLSFPVTAFQNKRYEAVGNSLGVDFAAPAIIWLQTSIICDGFLPVSIFLTCIARHYSANAVKWEPTEDSPGLHHAQMSSAMNLGTPQCYHPCTVLTRLETKLLVALWTKRKFIFFFRGYIESNMRYYGKGEGYLQYMDKLHLSA